MPLKNKQCRGQQCMLVLYPLPSQHGYIYRYLVRGFSSSAMNPSGNAVWPISANIWDTYRDYTGQGIRVVRTRKTEGGCRSPQGCDTDVLALPYLKAGS